MGGGGGGGGVVMVLVLVLVGGGVIVSVGGGGGDDHWGDGDHGGSGIFLWLPRLYSLELLRECSSLLHPHCNRKCKCTVMKNSKCFAVKMSGCFVHHSKQLIVAISSEAQMLHLTIKSAGFKTAE